MMMVLLKVTSDGALFTSLITSHEPRMTLFFDFGQTSKPVFLRNFICARNYVTPKTTAWKSQQRDATSIYARSHDFLLGWRSWRDQNDYAMNKFEVISDRASNWKFNHKWLPRNTFRIHFFDRTRILIKSNGTFGSRSSSWLLKRTSSNKHIYLVLTCGCHDQCKETQKSVHLESVLLSNYVNAFTSFLIRLKLKCTSWRFCQRCLITVNEFPQLPDFLIPLSLLTFGRPPFPFPNQIAPHILQRQNGFFFHYQHNCIETSKAFAAVYVLLSMWIRAVKEKWSTCMVMWRFRCFH